MTTSVSTGVMKSHRDLSQQHMRKFCDAGINSTAAPLEHETRSNNKGLLKMRHRSKRRTNEAKAVEMEASKNARSGLNVPIPRKNIEAIDNLVRKRNAMLKQQIWHEPVDETKFFITNYRTPHASKPKQVRYKNFISATSIYKICFIVGGTSAIIIYSEEVCS